MSSTQPIMKHVDSFTVTGFRVRTQNKDEFDEATAKLPTLWQQFYSTQPDANTTVFGVYSHYESNENGFYNVTVGIEGNKENMELSTIKINSGNYLVFSGKGPMPQIVIETWKNIWNYFGSECNHQRNFITDYEMYSHGDEVSIYIGVK